MLKNKQAGHFTKGNVPAIIILGAGILLSVLIYALVQRLEFKDLRNEFNYDTKNYSTAIQKSIEENLNSLHAIEGLYASSPKVTRARFHSFVNNILPHSSGLHSLRWIPRVAGAERKKYEASAIKDGYSTFRFAEMNPQKKLVTAGNRDEYFPVYYSESAGKNEAALGLDMSAHPMGRASLEKARDTGAMVASRRITLFLEADRQFAFLAIQPIYRNISPHDTLEERRKNLMGFAVGVFRFGDMVSAALKGISLTGIELSLFDESAAPERRMLYSNVGRNNSASEELTSIKTLNVADRIWTVKFHPTREYPSMHRTRYSWVVLAAGLIFTFLLALYVLKVKRHSFEMEQSKDAMSAVLNSIDAAIAIVDSKDMRISACNKVFIRESEVGRNEVIGRRCNDVVQKRPLPCDRLCKECPVTLTMRTGEPSVRESVQSGGDGMVKYRDISAYPIKDNAGNVLHAVYITRDITGRKLAENTRLEEQQVRRMSAERELVATQLRMLQAQIEPHFLFNTLANVISLIDKEQNSAKTMLQHLTNSLRLALERSREDISTLEQESEMLRDYLSIFKMRLGPRLDFIIEIPDELLKLPFPPMLLQPLVENAVKHGIEPKIDGGRISVKAIKINGLLRLSVSDTGLGFSDPMNADGLGLENVRARLHALYTVGAGLVLEQNMPCGATATIEVPL
jgi:CHASE1-domain containing sensor protein